MTIQFPSGSAHIGSSGSQTEVTRHKTVHDAKDVSGTPAPASEQGDVQPPVFPTGDSALFGTGGQIVLEHPPEGAINGSGAQQLATKIQTLLEGLQNRKPDLPANPPADAKNDPPPAKHATLNFDQILHLMLDVSVEEFQSARDESQQRLQEKVSDMDSAANDLLRSAQDRWTSGLISGIGAGVAGLASVGGAAASFRGVAKATAGITSAEAVAPVDLGDKAKMFERLSASYTAGGNAAQSMGSAVQSGGNIWSSHEELDAGKDDAAKTEDEKAVASDDAQHDNDVSMRQQYAQVMQDYLDKAKSYEQSQDQTMLGLARSV